MYSNNNMQLIIVKREINYRPIFFMCLMVLVINIFVFFGAVKVNKSREEIIKKYVVLKSEQDYKQSLKIAFQVNETLEEIKEEFIRNRTIIFTQNTQSKINATMKRKAEKRQVYLTFDDGPSKTVTPKILDVLKENEVNATFFVLGNMVNYYPDIVKRAYNEGNYIGNHGYSHVYSQIYASEEAFFEEILKTEKIIAKAIGKEEYNSHLIRFPRSEVVVVHIQK